METSISYVLGLIPEIIPGIIAAIFIFAGVYSWNIITFLSKKRPCLNTKDCNICFNIDDLKTNLVKKCDKIKNNIINYQLQSDIKSEGIIKIGRPKEMDKYYDTLFKKADSKSECRFSGHSMLKFFVDDYSKQKDNFINHIQKGMKLFVLLKADDDKQQSKEVTQAQIAENSELNRKRNFSMDLDKTLAGIAQIRNRLKNESKNNLKVRVTSKIMYTSINWIKKQDSDRDDGEMIVTHYMHQGMAERSRAIHIKAPCFLISDYREEFENLWDKGTDVPFNDT